MPVAINSSRPPSSPILTGSGSAPRTTTTSRRGGRTRSRSPPVMGGRGTSEGIPPPPNGDNPSSAAAAAAAAAKAFSSGGARPPWSDHGSNEDPNAFHHGYDKPFMGSSNWSGEEGHGKYGSRGRYPQGYDHGGHPPPHYRPSDPAEGDRYGEHPRYRGNHYDGDGRSGRHPRGGSHGGQHFPPPDYRYGEHHGRDVRDHRSSSRSPRSGGTSLVIGGTTPIHLPKSSDPSQTDRKPRAGSAASVFRGRPDSSAARSPSELASSDDSPQKILLSLRTPTTSFEDKTVEKTRKGSGGLTLSPDDPPPIQNSHQHRSKDPLFEPERSLEANKGSIDMAPSFALFNQSFDSFGDGYFGVDGSLQNDSFGLVRSASAENDSAGQIIRKNSSGGNLANQLLAGSGSGGALTIGYSPVNSFGNNSTSMSSRRGSNMMVLGGSDGRSASPTQVLGMYRSYSGGAPPRPAASMDDSHMRMSFGSFGGQSFARPYGDPSGSPHGYYPGPVRSHESVERTPPFYVILRKYRSAFKNCTFLLPGLKAALVESQMSDRRDGVETSEGKIKNKWDPSGNGHRHYHPPGGPRVYGEPPAHDVLIAQRRVECSVCAFGGNLSSERAVQEERDSRSSIFRGKDDPQTTSTSSSGVSSSGAGYRSRSRMKYEEELPGRYYENESRLSWEFEENPPVEISSEEDDRDDEKGEGSQYSNKDDGSESKDNKSKSESDSYCKPTGDDASGTHATSSSPQPKMRYRCKLCGQPKQNHRCPYQQSLARSIGVTVYPAVNSFTAAEPGTIAAPLSEMNNFVDAQKDGLHSSESSPNRPTPERVRHVPTSAAMSASNQVTPESMRSSPRLHSPPSFTGVTPARSNVRLGRQKKRLFSQMNGSSDDGDPLFVESMELKPEQFRIVSAPKSRKSREGYVYPALPLPYAQRKRLSDNLFSLSNEIPKLTDECAQVLREARERDMWDLAVSELMTQVIVVLHCPDGDTRFEGLRQYLLTLGIAC